jgi:N6-L-threonylcarbamoyladenine synthase
VPLILGIESTCDETAAALVRRGADGRGEILSNIVRSQTEEHRLFGGVVPEIASRAHVEAIDHVIRAAFREAGVTVNDIDAVAAAAGPGLIGGVIVGLTTAKAIALVAKKPLIAVNHLEGHALTPRLTDGVAFPYMLLLVSGGHTQLVAVLGVGRYEKLGSTIDDALGEAFDKVAKMLGLGYPGGPEVEIAALSGDPKRFAFPKPMAGRPKPDFSFSGLKTAVRMEAQQLVPLTDQDVADLCASFQQTASATVADRCKAGLKLFRERYGEPQALVVAGGVGANKVLRAGLVDLCAREKLFLAVPPPALCTDNGAMIAWAGLEKFEAGIIDDLSFAPRARWPLDPASATIGSGRLGLKA